LLSDQEEVEQGDDGDCGWQSERVCGACSAKCFLPNGKASSNRKDNTQASSWQDVINRFWHS
jgi:hypothetical protein